MYFNTMTDSLGSNWTYHEEVALVVENLLQGSTIWLKVSKRRWKTAFCQYATLNLFPCHCLTLLTCK
jgi:hypothetical protein